MQHSQSSPAEVGGGDRLQRDTPLSTASIVGLLLLLTAACSLLLACSSPGALASSAPEEADSQPAPVAVNEGAPADAVGAVEAVATLRQLPDQDRVTIDARLRGLQTMAPPPSEPLREPAPMVEAQSLPEAVPEEPGDHGHSHGHTHAHTHNHGHNHGHLAPSVSALPHPEEVLERLWTVVAAEIAADIAAELAAVEAAEAAARAAAAQAQQAQQVQPVDGDGGFVYLTFDDGPDPVWTPVVLDTLARYGAVATFFVMGGHVAEHPELVARAVAEGHGIENHTYWHVRLDQVDAETFRVEVQRSDAVIREALGDDSYTTGCLRPPFGAWDEYTSDRAAALGKRLIGWDFSPQDWIYQDPVKIANDTIRHTRPGSVLLFHDTNRGTAEALPTILSELQARGYRFGVLSC